MKRDLQALASQKFDLIVVGGGIAGISVARDAALRGLTVALVEQSDFASGSTGHTLDMIPGGLRCLQRLDLGRLRALSKERNTLLRNAPHLLHAVPIAVPTYGHGRDGKSALHAGLGLYDFLTSHRNDGITDSSRRVPPSRTIGRKPVLLIGFLGSAAVIVVLPWIGSLWVLMAVVGLGGVFVFAVRPVIQSWALDMTPPRLAGSMVSLQFGTQSAFAMAVPIGGGMIADRWGIEYVFYALAGATLIASAIAGSISEAADPPD